MKWYIADKDYIKYLHSIDCKVQFIDYENRIKPYIGIVMNIGDYKYYLPITSADTPSKIKKFSNMHNCADFHKLIDPDTKELIAVLDMQMSIEKYTKFQSKSSPLILKKLFLLEPFCCLLHSV